MLKFAILWLFINLKIFDIFRNLIFLSPKLLKKPKRLRPGIFLRDSPEPHSTYPVDSDPTSTVPAVIDNVEKCRKPMQNFYARFLVFFVVAQTRWRSWPQIGTTNHVSPTYLRVGKSLDVRQIHVFLSVLQTLHLF